MSTDPTLGKFLAELKKERANYQAQIAAHQREVDKLDTLIRAIEERWKASGPYNGLTLRGAILKYLAGGSGPGSVSEMAQAIQAGGFESKSADFRNAVSATLSQMASKWKEVESTDEGWALTDLGRLAAAAEESSA